MSKKGATESSTTKFYGPIWGQMPSDFPTEILQTEYRNRITIMQPENPKQRLMGMGFKGMAYRFKALCEYGNEFNSILAKDNVYSSIDMDYQQERLLFGFIMSGFSCIESFFFSMHALGSFYSEENFGLDNKDLQKVKPETVTRKYENLWSHFNLTRSMGKLINDPEYQRWKKIRNVITHRAVPPKLISVNVGESVVEVHWLVENAGTEEANELINQATTIQKRKWLSELLNNLVDDFSEFYPK